MLVPAGLLFRKTVSGESDYNLRKNITESKNLKAIVSLPNSTFVPYAKISTAILVIDRSHQFEHVKFINITDDLTTEQIDNVVNFVYLNSPNITNRLTVQLEDVIARNYDWQFQSYNQFEAAEKHDNINSQNLLDEIAAKEQELIAVRQQISTFIQTADKDAL